MSENIDTEYVIRGPQSLGMALREFRIRRGATQADIAKTSGLHRSYLSVLERGSTTDAMRYLVMVCRALDLEIVIRPRGGSPRDGA